MKILISTTILLLSVHSACIANELDSADPTDKTVDFARQVLPILSNKCFVCHGPDTAEKDALRLDTEAAATQDRGGYQAINPGNPNKSRALERIHSPDDPMPPTDAEKQLTPREREVLSIWIRQGGKYAQHWAFEPPVRDDSIPAHQAIDSFIGQRLAQKKIRFANEANKTVLARRVSLILTGLPPHPTRLKEFLADNSSEAYDRLVDGLLNDRRFGEHQARYWLDAVRYGDTHGLHLDNKRGIYPYRDWVVKAFNDNLPGDKFITWQLAGDLLPNPSLEQLVATGYVRLNPSTGEGGAIPAEFQCKNNFDRVETLGTVFLGMSLTCARCHTHKYDPIPQTEYYRLLAFFNSTAEPAMDGNKYEYGPTARVPGDQAAWQSWNRIQSESEQLLRAAFNPSQNPPADKPLGDTKTQLKLLADRKNDDAVELLKKIQDLEKTFTTSLIARDLDTPRPTHLLQRGEYDKPIGDPLKPGIISVMGSLPSGTPENRLGLANWLTSRKHPLVSRVLMNRMWQRTFGYGLVRTPEDFGLQGEQPTHPELLDWLAVEFMESGWDMKHMLGLMVTSRTFRQSSRWRTDVDDPENRLFARGSSYRLDAEVLRDIGLWSSNLLDAHMGGEGVKPYQPAGMWKALAHPGSNTKQYQKDTGPLLYRRSLYVYWKRTSPHPMMTLFDAPDRESSCVRRSRTNTSLQSLGLLNETQRIEMARTLAQRLLKESNGDAARLDLLFTLLASRQANDEERTACDQLLKRLKDRYTKTPRDAAALLAIGDAPRDKSLDAAEHAAWTQVAITVLASDLAILLY